MSTNPLSGANAQISFPLYYLQHDWNESLNSGKKETVWLQIKSLTDVKGKCLNLVVANHTLTIDPNLPPPAPDFVIVSCTNKCLIIEDKKSKVTHRFLPPLRSYATLHTKPINSLDVAANGIAVSASMHDSSLKVWDTVRGEIKHDLKGHLLDVNKCRFFPSNEVILSAGADMLLKIWSAIDGKSPMTLLGHHGPVTDVAMVDRGRNIISVGRDGFVKLWHCGSGNCVEDLFDLAKESEDHGGKLAINACAIRSIEDKGELKDLLGKLVREEPKNELAIGTENKLFLIGTESGFVYGIGVHNKKVIFKTKADAAVNCVAFVRISSFAYGTQSGLICECDLRNPDVPLRRWNLSHSPVLSLLALSRPFHGLVSGRQDGTVTFLYDDPKQIVYLSGVDCDPVYDITYDERFLYTGARDGKVRKYLLNYAFE